MPILRVGSSPPPVVEATVVEPPVVEPTVVEPPVVEPTVVEPPSESPPHAAINPMIRTSTSHLLLVATEASFRERGMMNPAFCRI
jgi:hypothetical protein